ncbi:hypothetical protein Syun_013905 [Stephania yunnanensis]|uniref:HMA domain-containing protein n=1 Tax=Stephania yunnanensis TaxID=152371 RepID=A0AAP0PBA1_9MAGN
MFSQHGANSHSRCSGLVNISSPVVHSIDVKLKSCVLKVNMHCDGCKQDVKKLLQRIEVNLVLWLKGSIDQAAVNEAHCTEENRLEQIFLKRHDYFGLSEGQGLPQSFLLCEGHVIDVCRGPLVAQTLPFHDHCFRIDVHALKPDFN